MARLYALIQRNAYPAWFSPVVPLERKAVRIHGWEPFVVPGLLQTEEYARELIRVSRPQDSAATVEELVTARMERQAILARDDPPMLWYVLDEGILHRMVGSAERNVRGGRHDHDGEHDPRGGAVAAGFPGADASDTERST
jgi:hypothetical protein